MWKQPPSPVPSPPWSAGVLPLALERGPCPGTRGPLAPVLFVGAAEKVGRQWAQISTRGGEGDRRRPIRLPSIDSFGTPRRLRAARDAVNRHRRTPSRVCHGLETRVGVDMASATHARRPVGRWETCGGRAGEASVRPKGDDGDDATRFSRHQKFESPTEICLRVRAQTRAAARCGRRFRPSPGPVSPSVQSLAPISRLYGGGQAFRDPLTVDRTNRMRPRPHSTAPHGRRARGGSPRSSRLFILGLGLDSTQLQSNCRAHHSPMESFAYT